jgi:hypothetical protein
MRAFRTLLTLCGAIALAAVVLVPGARADEYNKLTYLTFSGPVQVPGVTLPAGTYMFKLADPESGRRAIQIWDEKGTELFTTLLTIPDEQAAAQDDPVVLFTERPSGSPQAIKSWFYPGDRVGQEFIYPKNQAMKIAADAQTPVLAYTDELKDDADVAALHGAQVGRVDAQGQMKAETTTAASTTTAADADPAATATTASAADASTPSANRTESAVSAPGAASAQASTSTTGGAVGTSGTQDAAAAQPAQSARADQDELPRTASPLAAMQLTSLLLLAGALGARQLRRRLQ